MESKYIVPWARPKPVRYTRKKRVQDHRDSWFASIMGMQVLHQEHSAIYSWCCKATSLISLLTTDRSTLRVR